MDLEAYIDDFASLRRKTVNGEKAPHKPILLLAIINLFERGIIQDNYIIVDNSLKLVFSLIWNALKPKTKGIFFPNIFWAMWRMHKELFWHLIPTSEYSYKLRSLTKEIQEVTEEEYKEYVDHVELDSDLAFLLTLDFARNRLKEILLSTYFNKSLQQFEAMEKEFSYDEDDSIDEGNINEFEQDPFDLLNEDLRLLLHIEYYTFLKNNTDLRRSFCSYFPSVKEFYKRITGEKLRYNDVSKKFSDAYVPFLNSLLFKVEAEDESMFLLEDIKQSVKLLDKYLEEKKVEVVEQNKEPEIQSIAKDRTEQNHTYQIENFHNHTKIIDADGTVLYSSTGVTVLCSGSYYRISKTYSSLAINNIDKAQNGVFVTGLRIATINSRSSLYKLVNSEEVLQKLHIEKQYDGSFGFILKGFVFSPSGDVVSFQKQKNAECHNHLNTITTEKTDTPSFIGPNKDHAEVELGEDNRIEYIPKGYLHDVINYADSSFDFFWIMSIVDLMKAKPLPKHIGFEDMGLMMVANAWEFLSERPQYADKTSGLNKCIDYIKIHYPQILDRKDLNRDYLYLSLRYILQDNKIKKAIQIMTQKSAYNVLRPWFPKEDDYHIYINSLHFGNCCLYAIYQREEDSYITINPLWNRLFYEDNEKLYRYFKEKLLKYLIEK